MTGHRLTVDDFVKTLAVPKETLVRLLRCPLSTKWSDENVLLKTTGRYPLSEEDYAELGEAAERIPVIR